MYQVVVWHNKNKDSYYYRKYYSYRSFEVGDTNSYGHEVILVIDLTSNEKISFKRRVLTRLIGFLQNRLKNIK